MAGFIIYIIRWAVVLTLLYSLYGLTMKRETLHSLNRVVLLVILVASMVLPLCQIETKEPNYVMQGRQMIEFQISHAQNPLSGDVDFVTDTNPDNGVKYTHIPIREDVNAYIVTIVAVYIIGLIVCWLRYLWQTAALVLMICRSKRITIEGVPSYVHVVIHPDVKVPCSWMRWIILNPTDVNTNAIIRHEMSHIHYGHSWDMLLCELTCRMLWCVPFAWMLRQDLRDVHEFQADRRVLQSGIDENEYQLLLIRKATSTGLQPVVNALNQSPIKRRFKMMYSKPSRRWVALKAAYLLPLSALALMAFARPQTMDEIEEKVEKEVIKYTATMKQLTSSEESSFDDSAIHQQGETILESAAQDSRIANSTEQEQEDESDSVITFGNAYIVLENARILSDANLVKADLSESGTFSVPSTKSAIELLDSTMQAVGARKIAEGTFIGHFQPNLYSDTVRICHVKVLDRQSQVMMTTDISSISASDRYAYNLTLQAETRKDRKGYYIRFLQPVNSTVRGYDQRRLDPKKLSTDAVLIKEFNPFEFRPVAMERTKKETRLYFFVPIKTKGDAAFVEKLFEESFSNYAINDVKTGDKYMFRSMDKSYFKYVARTVDSDSSADIYQTCIVFPPLDKKVNEVKLAPADGNSQQGISSFKLSDISRKGRIINN